jgi:hypothetical protein
MQQNLLLQGARPCPEATASGCDVKTHGLTMPQSPQGEQIRHESIA